MTIRSSSPGSRADEQALKRLMTFSAVARELAQCTTRDELFQTAGRRLYAAGQMTAILVLSPDLRSLHTAYFYADDLAPSSAQKLRELATHPMEDVELPQDCECVVTALLADGKTRLVENVFDDLATVIPSTMTHRQEILPLMPSWRAIYALIRLEDEPAGILFTTADDLQESDLPTVELFANSLGSVWRGILHIESQARRREQLAAINHIAQEVNSTGPSLDDLAQSVVETLAKHSHYQRARLCLLPQLDVCFAAGNEDPNRPCRCNESPFLQHTLASQSPVLMEDVSCNEFGDDPALSPSTMGLLAVSVNDSASAGESQGVLWVESDWPGTFDEGDATALQAIASTIATGLNNVRLFEQVDTQLNVQVRQLRIQEEIGRAVTGNLDHTQVLYSLLDWTARALGTERSSLIIIDEQAQTMRIPYSIGTEQEQVLGFEAPLAGSLTEWVYQNQQVACIPDPGAPDWYTPYMAVWDPSNMPRNILFVPLLRGKQVIGVLGMMNKRVGDFDDSSVALVQALSPWATIALENAQMYQESLAQAERFERAIAQVGRALVAGDDLDDTLQTILALAEELLDSDASTIASISADGKYRDYFASRGIPDGVIPIRLSLEGSLGEEAIRTGQVVQVEDMLADERITYEQVVRDAGVRAQAVAALRHGEKLYGLLTVYRHKAEAYSAEDASILQAFAGQAALALERAEMMEENREQIASLAALMDTTSDAIMVLNTEGLVQYANRPAGETRAICQPGPAGGTPSLTTPFLRQILPRIQAGEFGQIELRLESDNGEGPWHLIVRLTPLRSRHEYLVVVTDVTNERRQDQLRYEFLRNIYHELQTPLTAILGYLQLMREDANLSEQDRLHCVQQAYRQAQRLRVLTDDLAAYAYLAESAIGRPATVSEPKGAIEETLDDIQTRYPKIKFTTRIEGVLPSVALESRQLRRVLRHLLDNAAKFSPRGAQVELRAGVGENTVHIAIQDWGIGIAPGRQTEIFDPFHQLDDRTERRYQGIGLGLPLVRQIVQSVGGSIVVDSTPGVGSTFTVTLPATVPPAA